MNRSCGVLSHHRRHAHPFQAREVASYHGATAPSYLGPILPARRLATLHQAACSSSSRTHSGDELRDRVRTCHKRTRTADRRVRMRPRTPQLGSVLMDSSHRSRPPSRDQHRGDTTLRQPDIPTRDGESDRSRAIHCENHGEACSQDRPLRVMTVCASEGGLRAVSPSAIGGLATVRFIDAPRAACAHHVGLGDQTGIHGRGRQLR